MADITAGSVKSKKKKKIKREIPTRLLLNCLKSKQRGKYGSNYFGC